MTQPASKSVLVGLIGTGIQASRTPPMHEREGAACGMNYVYRKIDIEKLKLPESALPELLVAAERMGFDGLNITHPFKQAVIPLLTELSEDARALGAVNTVVLRDGKRSGHNTDFTGYMAGFRAGFADVKRDKVVQLGAGGAGAAVANALMRLEVAELTVFDVERPRAEKLAAALVARFGAGRAKAGTDLGAAMAVADGLVHCTPTGMKAHPGLPLDGKLLEKRHWVSEIVYFPIETELLRVARQLGCRTLDGGGMAVGQAVDAFRLFTGVEPDAARMRAHFLSM